MMREMHALKICRRHIVEIIFSLFLGIAFSLANHLAKDETLSISLLQIIIMSIICYGLLYVIEICIDRAREGWISYNKTYGLKMYVEIWVVGLIVDLICLCAYFPGVGMNDGLNILRTGMASSNQFPVFYCAFITLLAKIGRKFGSLQISIALYSIIQVLAVSAACAFIIVWFFNKCAPKWTKYIVCVYLIGEPLLTMYAISMLKDTLFSVLVVVITIVIYDLIIDKDENIQKWEWLILGFAFAGVLCLRNNGSYIVFPIMLILLLICAYYRKQIVLLSLFSIAIVLLSNIAMSYYNQTQLFQEMVGIPLQQMAAVVANDGVMTEEQKDFMNQIMPLNDIKEKYNPSNVDSIKWQSETYNRDFLESHKIEFLITWAEMLPANFTIYVKAYLQQTFWFWAPYQEGTVSCCYTIESIADNTWLLDFMDENGIHDQPLLPESITQVIRGWFSLANKFLREGVCFWIILGTLLLQIIKNRRFSYICIYAPVLLLWLTIMISTPVASSIRYVLAFVYGLPIFIGLLFVKCPVSEDKLKRKG